MPENMMVLTFPEYEQPGQELARALQIEFKPVSIHRFPDGECSIRIPSPLPEHVIFCRSLNQPNEKLVELVLAISAARKHGAKKVTLVSPYLCYMRQDMEFSAGDAISQKIIGELLAKYIDTLITVDPHLHRISKLEEAVPIKNAIALYAAPLIGKFLHENTDNPLLVGPDSESGQWVKTIAEPFGLDYLIAEKQRSGDKSVSIKLPDYSYSDRDVIIVDDIISTGCTLVETAKLLLRENAREINTFVTHALLTNETEEYIRSAGIKNLWSTNSIIHSSNVISLAPLLANGLLDNGILTEEKISRELQTKEAL